MIIFFRYKWFWSLKWLFGWGHRGWKEQAMALVSKMQSIYSDFIMYWFDLHTTILTRSSLKHESGYSWTKCGLRPGIKTLQNLCSIILFVWLDAILKEGSWVSHHFRDFASLPGSLDSRLNLETEWKFLPRSFQILTLQYYLYLISTTYLLMRRT